MKCAWWSVLLALLSTHAFDVAAQCPDHCVCYSDHVISCSTGNMTDTLLQISESVTHLQLIMKVNHSLNQMVQDLDFSRLPNLEVLLLEPEGLRTGPVQITLDGLSQNKKLRVLESRVRLMNIEDDIFSSLMSLEQLTLSFTDRQLYTAATFLNASLSNKQDLHKLSLRHFQLTNLRCVMELKDICEVLKPLHGLRIHDLDLAQNDLYIINSCFVQLFRHLVTLDISENQLANPYPWMVKQDIFIVWLEMLLLMPTIKVINFSNQGYIFYKFKEFTDINYLLRYVQEKSQVKNVSFLSTMTENRKGKLFEDKKVSKDCLFNASIPLGNIERLSFDNMKMQSGDYVFNLLDKDDLCFGKNNVKYLSLSHNAIWNMKIIKKLRIFGVHDMFYVNLQFNDLDEFHPDLLTNLPGLRILLLGGNAFGKILNSSSTVTPGLNIVDNINLESLDLAKNSIQNMPPDFLFHNTNLQELNLSGNSIVNFTLNLGHLLHLKVLNLSSNHITQFISDVRYDLETIANVTIDLTNNPLSCGCLNLDFITWIQSTRIRFIQKDRYTCDHPFSGIALIVDVNVKDLRAACFPSTTRTIVLSVLLSASLSALITLSTVMYCKRWRLRYWLYILQRGWRRLNESLDMTEYKYDLFVAYNHHDSHWVQGPLKQELEVKRGFKLCIDTRDFPVGDWLADVIVDKIEESRKTLLVLSPSFVESNWCHFEMKMAHGKLFEEGKDVLVLVVLEDISIGSVNKTLSDLMEKKLYLEWTNNLEGQELFWRKLTDAIQKENRPFD